MISVKKEGILLKKTTLGFENEGVLNPAVISKGDSIPLFYRAASAGAYSSIGYCKLKGTITIEERYRLDLTVANKIGDAGIKAITANRWCAARTSGTEYIYKIIAESFLGKNHLKQIIDETQEIVIAVLEITENRV